MDKIIKTSNGVCIEGFPTREHMVLDLENVWNHGTRPDMSNRQGVVKFELNWKEKIKCWFAVHWPWSEYNMYRSRPDKSFVPIHKQKFSIK